jgi:hypothetical protein
VSDVGGPPPGGAPPGEGGMPGNIDGGIPNGLCAAHISASVHQLLVQCVELLSKSSGVLVRRVFIPIDACAGSGMVRCGCSASVAIT